VQLQEFVQEFGDTLPKLRRELVWSAPASAAAATARLTTLTRSVLFGRSINLRKLYRQRVMHAPHWWRACAKD